MIGKLLGTSLILTLIGFLMCKYAEEINPSFDYGYHTKFDYVAYPFWGLCILADFVFGLMFVWS